jgi:hypothetical protein
MRFLEAAQPHVHSGCVKASLVETNTNIAQARADLASPMPYDSVRGFDGLRAIELPQP